MSEMVSEIFGADVEFQNAKSRPQKSIWLWQHSHTVAQQVFSPGCNFKVISGCTREICDESTYDCSCSIGTADAECKHLCFLIVLFRRVCFSLFRKSNWIEIR